MTSVLGLTEDDISVILEIDRRTIDRWLHGALPQEKGREQLNGLEELKTELIDSLGAHRAREWLSSPSGYFGNLTPIQALRGAGVAAIPQVLAALESLETGASI
jgi:hypothetical protein